ncbi:unnamed protein product [Cyprideis torosa]|uniref:U3 small nucleolar RNA-associated protein 25 homolog n=1 Tax=Cyprideis torosa TaxID=163714 RepID=A0A7R8WDE3_9CRUS|nr:unnamed protein product [Cyprideis torosa]CAG0893063.1 unnamed protein product [Cyprideis torosa]
MPVGGKRWLARTACRSAKRRKEEKVVPATGPEETKVHLPSSDEGESEAESTAAANSAYSNLLSSLGVIERSADSAESDDSDTSSGNSSAGQRKDDNDSGSESDNEDDQDDNAIADMESDDHGDSDHEDEDASTAESDIYARRFKHLLEESVAEQLLTNSSDIWSKHGIEDLDPILGKTAGITITKGNTVEQFRSSAFPKDPLVASRVRSKLIYRIDTTIRKYCSAFKCNIDLNLLKAISGPVLDYRDVVHFHRTEDNAETLRLAYCLHSLNHVLATRQRVSRHSAKLREEKEAHRREELARKTTSETITSMEGENHEKEFRDQGFHRNKILLIVPFRDSAYRIVKLLSLLLASSDSGKKLNIVNKLRFEQQFSPPRDETSSAKPRDWQKTFTGNTDDAFFLSVSVTKKSLKLFAPASTTDILIASPLGLKGLAGMKGSDSLSSIELLVLDQLDVLYMQNWNHVLTAMESLHRKPSDSTTVDWARVHPWVLNGWGPLYRQTLCFSSLPFPEMNNVVHRFCCNYEGRITLNLYQGDSRALARISVPLTVTFRRIVATSQTSEVDDRFEFFKTNVFPSLRSCLPGTLLFIPNYFDFIRIRNKLKGEDVILGTVSEYSSENHVSKARNLFFHGKKKLLLYTERCHFYHRYVIKGVQRVIFYTPPMFPHLFTEICNLCTTALQNTKSSKTNPSITVYFTKFDALRLAGIVGKEKTASLLASDRSSVSFVTCSDST